MMIQASLTINLRPLSLSKLTSLNKDWKLLNQISLDLNSERGL